MTTLPEPAAAAIAAALALIPIDITDWPLTKLDEFAAWTHGTSTNPTTSLAPTNSTPDPNPVHGLNPEIWG